MRTVEADIGVNSGDAGMAYGPTGQPSIAYVRSNTQSLELTTCASDGTWQNTTVTTRPEFSLFKLVDLAFDREVLRTYCSTIRPDCSMRLSDEPVG